MPLHSSDGSGAAIVNDLRLAETEYRVDFRLLEIEMPSPKAEIGRRPGRGSSA